MTAIYILLALAVLVALPLAIVLLTQVENWSRDLTTNFAVTDDSSPDPRLRPIRTQLSPGDLAARVEGEARKLPRWELAKHTANHLIELHFVRTTPMLRFQDDIRVRIEPSPEGGSLLTAESRSRVGKGDLGQNPRNLRELLEAVRKSSEAEL